MARAKIVNTSKSPKSAITLAKLVRIFHLHADALDGPKMRDAAKERGKALGKLTLEDAAIGIALARGFSRLFTR